mmetsp:Transcript_12136/g.24182  ORF Transcript_12136/g.24182 Transcript_12136/m.24182 type:complete len:320 (+) Transcript_12136:76-1035(+)|eukprot:CAMPEP_0181294998 /NCGR_PEP_ID=MMETSP1101-20121128/3904_1 /TAXON_ID=46948 /ORGANISM="Rhodomonas abbreviata, Strain Caron Lab Isolate" /LENGTH=319 /DNA_ID=CAMNT_0023399703 /DNA_START=64 /DNA_END=1023 /DNA_ORIENTATION=+
MSETFKPGRDPSHQLKPASKSSIFEDLDMVIVALLVIVAALYVLLSPTKKIAAAAKTEAPRKTGSKRRARPPEPFGSINEVQAAIRKEGLESCNLIMAIDFTKSNQWNGAATFGGRSLHDVSSPDEENPYQRVMAVVARTLEPFDDDHVIPTFGFGDVETKANDCFPFYPDRHCIGLMDVLNRYNQFAGAVQMSGPTSFAPAIRKAIEIVKEHQCFHLLVIIADGQVDRREETMKAIVDASRYPLAIVAIGVGDGPWDDLVQFDDDIPDREFDNFQFVDFHAVEREAMESAQPVEPQFAMATLMELPAQYKSLKQQNKI